MIAGICQVRRHRCHESGQERTGFWQFNGGASIGYNCSEAADNQIATSTPGHDPKPLTRIFFHAISPHVCVVRANHSSHKARDADNPTLGLNPRCNLTDSWQEMHQEVVQAGSIAFLRCPVSRSLPQPQERLRRRCAIGCAELGSGTGVDTCGRPSFDS